MRTQKPYRTKLLESFQNLPLGKWQLVGRFSNLETGRNIRNGLMKRRSQLGLHPNEILISSFVSESGELVIAACRCEPIEEML